MELSGRSTQTVVDPWAEGSAGAAVGLSVACMTSGRRPDLLAGVLAPLRDAADEIVVAAEAPQAAEVHAALAGLVDTVLAFPPVPPADRPIAWLFGSCSGRWVFNIDDDEVPSPALVARLPELTRRQDITHAWIARRWLHPTQDTYIASAPWGTEFQLRLVRADARFLQFSEVFHRPVVCHGPGTFVPEPLWHLDTVLNPAARRRSKAAAYERERPGMRIAGLAHNLGMYVPELHPGLELAPVPAADLEAIHAALGARRLAASERTTEFIEVSAEDVDRDWVGPPYGDGFYRARLEVLSAAPSLLAGAQATVDVRVENHGDRTWRWGAEARPQVGLRYRWCRDGRPVPDAAALLTALPVDIPPGHGEIVPVHVVAPAEPGVYELAIDLAHDGVRDFGVQVTVAAHVRRQPRIAVVAPPARLPEIAQELALPPDAQLVAVLRDDADRDAYGDYESIPGPRQYVLAGTSSRSRPAAAVALLHRTGALLAHRAPWRRPGYERLLAVRDRSEALVIDTPNWEEGAAFGREWSWVAAAILLWRRGGKPTVVQEAALPGGNGIRERLVRGALRRLARS